MKQIYVFVSYSHKDERWVSDVNELSFIPWLVQSLKRENVEFWFDHALKELPGEDYKNKIKGEIERADLMILLISQNFANSDFIYDYELPWIKLRVEEGRSQVIPILVGPVDLGAEKHLEWVRERQMLPGRPTPLINYTKDDAEFQGVRVEILQAIRSRVRQLQERPDGESSRNPGLRHASEPANAASDPAPVQPLGVNAKRRKQRLAVAIAMVAIIAIATVGYELNKERGRVPTSRQQSPLTAGDYTAVDQTALEYASLIRESPLAAAVHLQKLQAFADRLQADHRFAMRSPRAVATVYRLLAAALLFQPAKNPVEPIRQGSPWLQRALELYPDFQDTSALREAQGFFNKVLLGQAAHADAAVLIRHQFRVAMIETSDAEVEKQTAKALETMTGIIRENDAK